MHDHLRARMHAWIYQHSHSSYVSKYSNCTDMNQHSREIIACSLNVGLNDAIANA